MATTTQIHVVKVAVADGLAQRAGLTGMQISTAGMGQDTKSESIQLIGEDTSDQDWAQIGRFSREEKLTLRGAIYVEKPGGTEAIIRAVRARAVAIYAEIEAFIKADPSLAGTVKQVQVTSYDMREGANPDGRFCAIGFDIHTMARLNG